MAASPCLAPQQDYYVLLKTDPARVQSDASKAFGYPDWLRWRGSVLRAILPNIALVAVFNTVICVLHLHYGYRLSISSVVLSSLSIVLGLLLVFRSNHGYDRFWEGRRLWAQLASTVGNMTRRVWVGFPSGTPDRLAEKKQIITLLAAYMIALKHWVRREKHTHYEDYHGMLPERLMANKKFDVPMELLYQLTSYTQNLVAADKIDAATAGTIYAGITTLEDFVAQFARIRYTPIPLAYLIHMKQAVLLYCFALPFVLVGLLGYITVPMVASVAFLLFGMDAIGGEIEDPFGYDANDLPLDYFCQEARSEAEYVETQIPEHRDALDAVS